MTARKREKKVTYGGKENISLKGCCSSVENWGLQGSRSNTVKDGSEHT